MEFEQIYYPFSGVSSAISTNNSKSNNTFLYLGLIVLFIGGGIYAYNRLSYKINSNEP